MLATACTSAQKKPSYYNITGGKVPATKIPSKKPLAVLAILPPVNQQGKKAEYDPLSLALARGMADQLRTAYTLEVLGVDKFRRPLQASLLAGNALEAKRQLWLAEERGANLALTGELSGDSAAAPALTLRLWRGRPKLSQAEKIWETKLTLAGAKAGSTLESAGAKIVTVLRDSKEYRNLNSIPGGQSTVLPADLASLKEFGKFVHRDLLDNAEPKTRWSRVAPKKDIRTLVRLEELRAEVADYGKRTYASTISQRAAAVEANLRDAYLGLVLDRADDEVYAGNLTRAGYWYSGVEKYLVDAGRGESLEMARAKQGRGKILFREDEVKAAYREFRNALDIYEKLALEDNIHYHHNLIQVAGALARDSQNALALWYFNRAEVAISDPARLASFAGGALAYNRGVLFARQSMWKEALRDFQLAEYRFFQSGYINSSPYLYSLLNLGLTRYMGGDYAGAGRTFRELAVGAQSLGDGFARLRGVGFYLAGMSLEKAGAKAGTILRKHGNRILRRKRQSRVLRQISEKGLPYRLETEILAADAPPLNLIGLTPEATGLVSREAGRYKMKYHKPDIQARTYAGRQDDTIELLKDVLAVPAKKTKKGGDDSSAAGLSERDRSVEVLYNLARVAKLNPKGRNAVFVDIGPAIANRFAPAVTAREVAEAFPEMKVVGLDLPQQVSRYFRIVPKKHRRKLESHKNFFILSGDGLDSLAAQFTDEKKWVLKDRGSLRVSPDQLMVVRAVNSIDIYFPWSRLKKTIKQMAIDFQENPVLLHFHRTLLFKPRGERNFKLVGHFSVRGFHHNRQIHDRWGEEPFYLSKKVLDYFAREKRENPDPE